MMVPSPHAAAIVRLRAGAWSGKDQDWRRLPPIEVLKDERTEKAYRRARFARIRRLIRRSEPAV